MLNEVKNKLIATAASQVGRAETPQGSNWGTVVKMYLNSVGINFPAPWCMAFIVWCTRTAYTITPLIKKIDGGGSCAKQWAATPTKYRSKVPQPGFVGIMDKGNGNGHTFFVEKIVNTTTIQTIEGNTNNDGSRNGYGVFRLSRNVNDKKIVGYINMPLWVADVNKLPVESTNGLTETQKKK